MFKRGWNPRSTLLHIAAVFHIRYLIHDFYNRLGNCHACF